MDIVSSASAVVGLVFNFATAAKTCKAVRGRYKDANLTIDSIRQELETLQAALQQLANLMMHDASALTSQWDTDQSLSRTFARSVRGFERTIRELQTELDKLKLEKQELGRLDKAKVVWNEDGMREHLARLRSQAGALQLLLHVIQVGAVSEVKQHVKNLESALLQASLGDDLDKSDERPSQEHTTPQDPGDLLDLTWSEKNSDAGTTRKLLRTSYPGLIPTTSEVDYDALDADSMSSNDPSPREKATVDVSEDIQYGPTAQQYNNERKDRTTFSRNLVSRQPTPVIEHPHPAGSLVDAVITGDVTTVTKLLENSYHVDTEHQNGRTGLMWAAILNDFKVLQVFLDTGANTAAQDSYGRTALHFAAAEGSYRCAELLLLYGAPVDKYDDFEENPLHRAVRYGKLGIIELMLPYYSPYGLDPMSFPDGRKRSILHLAVEYSTIEAVEMICNHIRLVQHSKGCSIKREKEFTSDQRCLCPATYPHLSDADINGHTAFHTALIKGRQNIVTYLLKCEAACVEDPMAGTSHDLTPEVLLGGKPLRWRRPLHYALKFELAHGDMYKILVAGGADVNSKDSRGRTPLMVARDHKNADATALLLLHGAKSSTPTPNKKDHTNTRPTRGT